MNSRPNANFLSRRRGEDITPEFKDATDRHREAYKRLLLNNQHLISVHGKTLISQLKEFREKGLKISRQCYYDILKGSFFSLNYALPYYLSDYWGIPVQVLLYEELRTIEDVERARGGLPIEKKSTVE